MTSKAVQMSVSPEQSSLPRVQEFSIVPGVSIPLEHLVSNTELFRFAGYEHQFRLALSYPLGREFADSEELRAKIAEFNDLCLKPDSAAILYQVDKVSVGAYDKNHILGFTGTMTGEYLEVTTDEVVTLLTLALEGFFL